MLATARLSRNRLRSRLLHFGTAIGLVLGLAPSASASWAGEFATNTGDYTIENWQVEEGLPQISVISIAQTPDGYLWLGTFNGLARFDGVRFTIFNEDNAPALGSSGIGRLLADAEDGLWVLTHDDRLVRLAGGEFTLFGPELGLPSSGVRALVRDLEGHCLLVARDGALHRFENGRWIRSEENGVGTGPRLLPSPGELWWLEERGKVVRTAAPLRLLRTGASASSPEELFVRCAAPSHQGGLWLAGTSGVWRFKQGHLQGPPAPFPPEATEITTLAEDRRGNIWVGSWAGGLFKMDPAGQWERFSAGAGLAENDVVSVFVDQEDDVWVGTGRGGLHRFKPRIFHTYDTRDGLAGNLVMSVTEDQQGRLWVGVNGGGLNRRENGRLGRVTEHAELSRYEFVYSVLADRQGGVWAGLYGAAVLRLYAGAMTRFDLGDGSPAMTPRALFEDRAGTLWLGCNRGLQRYEGGHFTGYTCKDGLAHEQVRALAQDRSGTLYIATQGGGLSCFRNNQFSCYTEQDGLADNHLRTVYVDPDDTLWLGTVSGGLDRFCRGRFTVLTTHDGLPSNSIGTILEDDTGHLWLGSNRGIVRVNRRELNGYLDGRRSTLTCRVFNCSDGLAGVDCTGGGQPSACKTRDGKLWFATIKGLAVVDPAHLPANSLPPPVVLEEVVLDGAVLAGNVREESLHASAQKGATKPGHEQRPLLAVRLLRLQGSKGGTLSADSLEIPPGKHRLEFRFSALSLVAPEKVRFRYRLNGLDTDWREGASQRTASYNYVPPGEYRFEVTACNNDGVWNETGVSLGLAVLPPWWMTWWFRTLMGLSVAAGVFGWHELRLHRLRREHQAQESFSRQLIASQENERQRIAGELHDGMGQDLLVIASQAQLSLAQDENSSSTTARLKDIAETAKQALQLARRMAHNLRPGLVEELGFTKAVQATLRRAAQASGISVAGDLANIDGLLAPEFEVNLFRIIQETLNNVLKHAGATEAKVTLTKQPAALRLVVEDNGRGFDLSRLESAPPGQRGFGLRQIAERAKIMGGRSELQSRPGQGTRLTVEIPLRACGTMTESSSSSPTLSFTSLPRDKQLGGQSEGQRQSRPE
jgi:signal transduction histidine kinase/ligand-binding sensor domain-containing protein